MSETRIALAATPAGFPAGFEQMYYIIETSMEKFSVDKLHEFFRAGSPDSTDDSWREGVGYVVVLPPRDPQNNKYHVHLSWYVEDDSVELTIKYQPTLYEQPAERDGPYADDVMGWLGQFFKYKSAQAHIHSVFTFPLATRQSRFPLPMRIDVAGEAELDGISLRLPPKPNGVIALRLMLSQTWDIETIAERRVIFKSFDQYIDAHAIADTVNTILIERTL